MALTEEHKNLLAWRKTQPKPTGDQEPEQAFNLAIASFKAACQFEGIPVPGGQDVAEALRELPA